MIVEFVFDQLLTELVKDFVNDTLVVIIVIRSNELPVVLVQKSQLVPKLKDLISLREVLPVFELDEVFWQDQMMVVDEPDLVVGVPLEHSEEGPFEL